MWINNVITILRNIYIAKAPMSFMLSYAKNVANSMLGVQLENLKLEYWNILITSRK